MRRRETEKMGGGSSVGWGGGEGGYIQMQFQIYHLATVNISSAWLCWKSKIWKQPQVIARSMLIVHNDTLCDGTVRLLSLVHRGAECYCLEPTQMKESSF